MNAILEQELANLGPAQKLELELIEKLWDSLDADAIAPPMSDELYAELERRAQRAAEHPEESVTLEEIAKELGVRL
jgi:putative addiction module component (TIGR02574 family)